MHSVHSVGLGTAVAAAAPILDAAPALGAATPTETQAKTQAAKAMAIIKKDGVVTPTTAPSHPSP